MSFSRKNVVAVVLLSAVLIAAVGCNTSGSGKKPFSPFQTDSKKTAAPKKPAPEFSTVPDFVGGRRPDFF